MTAAPLDPEDVALVEAVTTVILWLVKRHRPRELHTFGQVLTWLSAALAAAPPPPATTTARGGCA